MLRNHRSISLTLLLVIFLAEGRPTLGAVPPGPNILFILVDDLDYQTALTPRLLPRVNRLLAREGTTFARAYAQHGLCSPSRATMLTGRYAQNTGVRRNTAPFGGFETFRANGMERASINVRLQRAGYRTGLIGKFINGYPRTAADNHVPPGWNYWAVSDWAKPYGYNVNENGRWRHFGTDTAAYGTDVFSRKAQEFIGRAADAAEPFALFLWFGAIHAPVVAAPRHAGLFPAEIVPRRPSFNEGLIYDKPRFLRYPPLAADQIADLDEKYRQRLRSVQAVDESVGALYGLLQNRGLLADTYICSPATTASISASTVCGRPRASPTRTRSGCR